jgi:hypothetical protein
VAHGTIRDLYFGKASINGKRGRINLPGFPILGCVTKEEDEA